MTGRPGQPGKNASEPAGLAGRGEPQGELDLAHVAAPGAGGAAASPAPTYTDHLAALRATCAALAQPTDEERWPWLAYPWADGTGSFERIVADA